MRDEMLVKSKGDFKQLIWARRSVRHFDVSQNIDEAVILEAIQLAQQSPSSCNRQSPYVYIVKDKEIISKILCMHNGAQGFSDETGILFIVCGDLRVYGTTAERNLVYVDASMFAMSLLYSLTYKGLGACPLHWCMSPDADRKLRKIVSMNKVHVPALLIAVGALPESFSVANSERFPLECVMTFIK